MAFANILLKTGEIVQISEEKIDEYLKQNSELIQTRKFKARRSMIESSETAISNTQ